MTADGARSYAPYQEELKAGIAPRGETVEGKKETQDSGKPTTKKILK